MLNEIRAALKQWHDDTKYITKIAPNDWGIRAHTLANKTVVELYIKIDTFEAEKAKELSDALAKLAADKDAEILALQKAARVYREFIENTKPVSPEIVENNA